MTTYQAEVNEFNNFRSGKLKPSVTRGIVVSTEDPLYAGRVKVWLPAIHGASPYDERGDIADPDDEADSPENTVPGVASSGSYKDSATQAGLPWAKVLSHNLGPNYDLDSGLTTSAGLFSTPSVGTEVMVMFENDDPTLPIVVGSIIHSNEFKYSLARPIEYLPGITLSDVLQNPLPNDPAAAIPVEPLDYPDLVSTVYHLRTNAGGTLFISDRPENRSIVLEGVVGFNETSTLTALDEAQLSRAYPAFPTTASAAFSKRRLLGSNTLPQTDITATTFTNEVNGATVSTTNKKADNSEAIEKEKAASAASPTINKTWPVSGAPRWSSGLGEFGTRRPPSLGGKVHVGIDIAANADGTTKLVAPIDCYPLYITETFANDGGNRIPVGITLLVLGVDGYAHSFLHLKSVEPKIQQLCQNPGKSFDPEKGLVKMGTVLGVCGITQKSTHNSGPHLHWEVFNAGDARSGNELNQRRSTAIKKASPNVPPEFISGKDWMKASSVSSQQAIATMTPEQAKNWIEYDIAKTKADESNYSKPAGLEISLSPGRESVMLRHPSGSFIGFDPDGNILIYSSGDINFRVNRSITYDVLGAILESAYAKFSRIKTVNKIWSGIYSAVKNILKANDSMPEFFTRVEKSREVDMANALSSTVGNSIILDFNNTLVSASDIINSSTKAEFITQPTQDKAKNYDLSIWDDLLKTMYNKYIKPNQTAVKIFSDINDFKSLMLHESDGDERAKSKTGATGLFQLTGVAFQEVLGRTLTDTERQSYYKADKNAEIAFQYIVKVVGYIVKGIQQLGVDISTIAPEDLRYLVIISYNQGPTKTVKAITEVYRSGRPITYKNVEAQGITSAAFRQEALVYVPNIEFIKSRMAKIV